MECLALCVSWIMGAVLLWAGLEKARNLELSAATLVDLGVPHQRVRPLASLLVVAEVCVGFGLIFRPDWVLTQVGVVVLAAAFALAGIIALGRGDQIRCNCFGWDANGRLGWNQILSFALWFAGAALLHVALAEPLSPPAGAVRLSAMGLAMATFRAIVVWRARIGARDDRVSAMKMYLWPH